MENKKEFLGTLKQISPRLLVDEKDEKEIQNFFLILGLIFNDLKGLVFFQKFLEENYRKPKEDETTEHAGEYNGLMAQADRLLISTVGEFYKFIEKNKSVLNSYPFLFIIKKLSPNIRNKWSDLVNLEHGSTILSKIAKIRSNVAFHYDHPMKVLRKGFIGSFFSERKNIAQHLKACYSLGEDMEHTRFYFSDASAQDYVNSLIGAEDRAKIKGSVEDMNNTIQALLRAYLENLK